MLIYGANTDVGRKRNSNQDMYYVSNDAEYPVFLVADGMGGHNSGEVASEMCKNYIVDYIAENKGDLKKDREILKVLKGSVETANTNIYLKSQSEEKLNGMGTTVTLSYILDGDIYLAHVGDSRAYLLSKSKLKQLTEDHSYVNELLKIGSISEEEAKNHPKKNMITRAVGSSSVLEVDTYKYNGKKNDILILTSDGVTNHVTNDLLVDVFDKSDNLQESCDQIIDLANKNGGTDNITIVAVKL